MSEAEVTVICTVYNHVRYLRQCLDSLVAQETVFPYRIIVHDDASTDGSADIVAEYAERHPDKVIPVLQKDNLYSRGISRYPYLMPLIEGRYVAVCEGDDYWCDPRKLQTQYRYREDHPECSLCTHLTYLLDEEMGSIVGVLPRSGGMGQSYSTSDVIVGGGGLFGTNSMFYKAEYYGRRPDSFKRWGIGDWPLCIYLSTQGEVHCIGEALSVYRMNALGSWSARNKDADVRRRSDERIVCGLDRADAYTGFEFHDAFVRAKESVVVQTACDTGIWDDEAKMAFRSQMRGAPLKGKVVVAASRLLPGGAREHLRRMLYRCRARRYEGVKTVG